MESLADPEAASVVGDALRQAAADLETLPDDIPAGVRATALAAGHALSESAENLLDPDALTRLADAFAALDGATQQECGFIE